MRALEPPQCTTRVVVAGGGVAALEALVALRSLAPETASVTLVSPSEHFVYRPLQVGEPFGLGQARRYSLEALCRDLDAAFVNDGIAAVDPAEHTVTLAGGQQRSYDILLLAIGAQAYPAFENGVTFDREELPEDFDEVLSASGEGLAERIAIVVPAGATWTLPAYELALLTASSSACSDVTVVTYEDSPLCAFGAAASAGVAVILAEAGVAVLAGQAPNVVSANALRTGWEWVEASRIVTLPLVSGRRISGVPCDVHGFVDVDDHGRVRGLQDVYAAGDGTAAAIKQGGLAAQQAGSAASHIAARLGSLLAPAPARPVLRGLLLTQHGPRYLRAELDNPDGSSTISDEPLWWPPSKIASRWLAPYLGRLDTLRSGGVVATGSDTWPAAVTVPGPGRWR